MPVTKRTTLRPEEQELVWVRSPRREARYPMRRSRMLATKQEVVLFPDADEAGVRWLEQAVEKLSGRVPRLLRASVPEGCKDVTDVAERALSRGEDPAEAAAEVLHRARRVAVAARPASDAFQIVSACGCSS